MSFMATIGLQDQRNLIPWDSERVPSCAAPHCGGLGQRSDECFSGGVPCLCSSGSSAATKGRPKVPRFSIAL